MKQRLVGACVLVLIAVWLVPELFVNEESGESPVEVVEPESEEFSSRIVPLEETEEESAQSNGNDTAPVEASTPESETEGEPESESQQPEPEPESAVVVEEEEISEAVVTVTALAEDPAEQIPEIRPLLPVPLPKPRGDGGQDNGERLGLTVWAIQLGSFGKSANALGLRDRLRGKRLYRIRSDRLQH